MVWEVSKVGAGKAEEEEQKIPPNRMTSELFFCSFIPIIADIY